MSTKQGLDRQHILARRVAALRIAFGLMWAVDAGFKWTGTFVHGFKDEIASAAQGQPGWLHPWFDFWLRTVGNHGTFFAYATAAAETLIAIGLLFGFGRRVVYTVAFLFGLAIWAIPEGFGGPYSAGAMDMDTGIGEPAWAVDAWIERRRPGWQLIAEPKGRQMVAAA